MRAGGLHVGVMFLVPRAVEEAVGITPLHQAEADEMQHRIDVRAGDVRIAPGIPDRVEEAGHHPDESGLVLFLRRHRGSSRVSRSRFGRCPGVAPGWACRANHARPLPKLLSTSDRNWRSW